MNWLFYFHKCLLLHLPCMERALSLRGHLEGSKNMEVSPLCGWPAGEGWKRACGGISALCGAARSSVGAAGGASGLTSLSLWGQSGSLPSRVFCSSFVNILLHSQVPSCQKNVLILGVNPQKVSKTCLEGKSHLLFLEEKSSTQNRSSSFSPCLFSTPLAAQGSFWAQLCVSHTFVISI